MEEYYIEGMVKRVQQYGTDYCQTSHQIFYEDTGKRRDSTRKNGVAGAMEEIIDILYFIYVWGKMYSAIIIRENNLLFDERLCCGEDNSFNFEFFAHVKRTAVIPQTLSW